MPDALTLVQGSDGVWRAPVAPSAARPDLDEWLRWRIKMRTEMLWGAGWIAPAGPTIFGQWYTDV